jgi:hypothetical protein
MTTLTAPLPVTPLHVGGLTLEERLDDAWEGLQGHGAAACPVCGDRMALAGEAGRCGSCGSQLR